MVNYNLILYSIPFILFCFNTTTAQGFSTGISSNNTYDIIDRLEEDVLTEDPDTVLMMIGTNDRVNSRKFLPYRDYVDNMREIIGKLKAKDIKTNLICPLPIASLYLFKRHDEALFNEPPNQKIHYATSVAKHLVDEYDFGFTI